MELIGNENIKKQIRIATTSATVRNRSMPHMLFAGAAGCGKTSMAKKVAEENIVDFIPVSAQAFIEAESVMTFMETQINYDNYDAHGNVTGKIKPSIIFIDEIHQLKVTAQEILGIAMENFILETNKPNQYYWTPYFTLIGATTNDGILTKPFRDRFGLRFVFEPYKFEEVQQIIKVHASIEMLNLTPRAIRQIAQRSRGVPRIAVGFLKRVRDMAVSHFSNLITAKIVEETFKELGIDKEGLTKVELKILKCLYDEETPVGLDNLSIIVGEAPKTLTLSAEPFLIQKGFLMRSNKGRKITTKGREYLESCGYQTPARQKRELIPANYQRT